MLTFGSDIGFASLSDRAVRGGGVWVAVGRAAGTGSGCCGRCARGPCWCTFCYDSSRMHRTAGRVKSVRSRHWHLLVTQTQVCTGAGDLHWAWAGGYGGPANSARLVRRPLRGRGGKPAAARGGVGARGGCPAAGEGVGG